MEKELFILIGVCIGLWLGFIIGNLIYYKIESWKIYRYRKNFFNQPIDTEPMVLTKEQQKMLWENYK